MRAHKNYGHIEECSRIKCAYLQKPTTKNSHINNTTNGFNFQIALKMNE